MCSSSWPWTYSNWNYSCEIAHPAQIVLDGEVWEEQIVLPISRVDFKGVGFAVWLLYSQVEVLYMLLGMWVEEAELDREMIFKARRLYWREGQSPVAWGP